MTAASLRRGLDRGLTPQDLADWYARRAGGDIPPAVRLLLAASSSAPGSRVPPLQAARRLVLELPDAGLLDGLLQHPATRPWLGERLGPTAVVIPENRVAAAEGAGGAGDRSRNWMSRRGAGRERRGVGIGRAVRCRPSFPARPGRVRTVRPGSDRPECYHPRSARGPTGPTRREAPARGRFSALTAPCGRFSRPRGRIPPVALPGGPAGSRPAGRTGGRIPPRSEAYRSKSPRTEDRPWLVASHGGG